MSRSSKKKPEPPQEEGAPAWMNTYGDMVTLLLTFFVLLFSFSTIDAVKWQEIAYSFSGVPFISVKAIDPGTDSKVLDENQIIVAQDTPQMTAEPTQGPSGDEVKEEFDKLYEEIKAHIAENGLDTELSIEKQDQKILLRISDSALFDSGKADIKVESLDMLERVAEIFEKYNASIQMIRIEGHTDNVPIVTSQFKDNWDLSTSRATSVLRYFLAHSSLLPAQFSAVGYGEFHPVASNETNEGKAQNRRVDFVIQSYAYE